MKMNYHSYGHPQIDVHVVERADKVARGALSCVIDEHLTFDADKLESYFFTQWNHLVYDAMLLAAAVEFCDMSKRRPAYSWRRSIRLRLPVHDLEHWRRNEVLGSLQKALEFLTGDCWHVSVYARQRPASKPDQGRFSLGREKVAVIPFSDGLDSMIGAGLASFELGEGVVRVRLGTKKYSPFRKTKGGPPFTSVPYKVHVLPKGRVESSALSRGFKFLLLSGLAAYLSDAHKVIIPESGQGALGSSLIPVGQAYPDYRSHPRFARKMESFLEALLGCVIQYEFPHIWCTKGETLNQYIRKCPEDGIGWQDTRSCWQQNRQIGFNGESRQCGVCAACMLRRLAVHAAGQAEPDASYVWENLRSRTFEGGASPEFPRRLITGAMREYAIAGVLHLEHLARILQSSGSAAHLALPIFQLGRSLDMDQEVVREKLCRLLEHHKVEWENYMASLGSESFVVKVARGGI